MTRVRHRLENVLERNHNNNARSLFCDMDGVIVDFDQGRRNSHHDHDTYKLTAGSYLNLKPYDGVIDNLTELINRGWDVWIATKIPTDNPYAAAEKLFWIEQYMPWFRASVIITPNKGCLGDINSVLIDDRPHKAMCREFKGDLLTYGFENEYKTWDDLFEKYFNLQDPFGQSITAVAYERELAKIFVDTCNDSTSL